MSVLFYMATTVATFFIMEGVAWASHKYLMHGLLWSWHEDHHVKEPGFFEKNDRFFLLFAIPSMLCIMTGTYFQIPINFSIGLGIAIYGACYFLVHDVFIHQRFKWVRNIDHPYFHAIRKAHYIHHRHKGKEHGECFGMLWVPIKFFKQAWKNNQKKRFA